MTGKVLAAVVSVGLWAAPAFAHEHVVLGTVTTVSDGRLAIRTPEGSDATVLVTAATKVTARDGSAAGGEAIAPGVRIAVTTRSDTPPYSALAIRVGRAGAQRPAPRK